MSDPKTSPFVGVNGEPLLRNGITAFLDILGFSQFCGEHTEIDKAQDLLQRIANAISNARDFLRSSRTADDESLVHRGVVKFFSDNLLYAHACETDADVVISAQLVSRLVQQYQLAMALNGFFVRGGMTQGLICVTDDIIFGNALIKSYVLESKTSIVPRVIICPELLRVLEASEAATKEVSTNDLLCRDVDGWWFVNYLNAAVRDGHVQWDLILQHKERILSALSSSQRHDVLPKFGWLTRYHNMFCFWHRDSPDCPSDVRIVRTDEESVIRRWTEVSHPV